ncbi:hypothetical protein Ate01nite_46240 [Actinoplanes teichomyceticus]|nr:hypothetical protein Ate01nite_46240 [Actinoplanes teichomyceticus]
MTLCDNCGSPVTPGDAFCGVCGAFLDWAAAAPRPAASGPVAAVPAGPGAVPEAPVSEPRPAASGLVGAVPEVPVSEPRPAASGPVAAVPEAPVSEPRPAEEEAASPEPPAAAETPQEAPRETPATPEPEEPDPQRRAAALVIPVAEATLRPIADPIVVPKDPTADQPGAVQPGRPVAPRPVLREFADVPDMAGEVTCPNCEARNPADRAFCRRCGHSLRAERAVERTRRRFRLRLPRNRGRLRRLLAVLAVLALLVALVWAGVQYGPRMVDAVRDRTATPKLVTPDAVTASSSARGHGPSLISDGLNNRYWAPAEGKGKGAWVELTFDKPIRVLNLIVHGGVSPQQQKYAGQGRPADVLLTLWTPDGKHTDRELHLVDRSGPQTFEMAVGDVTRMRLTVRSGYGLTGGKVPAIAEIEVFKRP